MTAHYDVHIADLSRKSAVSTVSEMAETDNKVALFPVLEVICEFVDNTDFVQTVMDAVGSYYVSDILRDANDLIEYKKDKLARRTKMDDFMDILAGFLKTMSDRTSDDKIGEMLSEAVSKVVGEAVDSGEISEVIEAMRVGRESAE